MLPLRMSVAYISFSAHADFNQTSEFIDALKPPHIILVHGEESEMNKLKQALIRKYANTTTYNKYIYFLTFNF